MYAMSKRFSTNTVFDAESVQCRVMLYIQDLVHKIHLETDSSQEIQENYSVVESKLFSI